VLGSAFRASFANNIAGARAGSSRASLFNIALATARAADGFRSIESVSRASGTVTSTIFSRITRTVAGAAVHIAGLELISWAGGVIAIASLFNIAVTIRGAADGVVAEDAVAWAAGMVAIAKFSNIAVTNAGTALNIGLEVVSRASSRGAGTVFRNIAVTV